MESENSIANSNAIPHTTVLFALKLPCCGCAILAADSPKTSLIVKEIVHFNMARIVELYPKVVAGFCGDYEVIHILANVLPGECRFQLPNPSSMQDVADLVAMIFNQSLDLIRRKDPDVHREVGIVVVGVVGNNDDFKIFNINNNGREYAVAHEELGNMYSVGTGKSGMNTFCTNSSIDDIATMSEEEGVNYAFKGVNYAVRNNGLSGRPIHVISINPKLEPEWAAKYHMWTQDNPDHCDNEYIYRGVV